jgi:hypothetical protein
VKDNFTVGTLIVAAAAMLPVLAAIRVAPLRTRLTTWTRETTPRRVVCWCLAITATAVWLLHAVYTERTVGAALEEVRYNIAFTLDETFAVLDGRSPLVDFVTQYGALWPYAFAAGMAVLGTSVGVWVALAVATTGVGMLAIFAVLRRAARSSIRGLLLFLPILATSFLLLEGTSENRYTFANYYAAFPLRYAGPSILAWLVARQLDADRPRWWPVFLVAGLVALNNLDAGIPALGATVAAALWGGGRLTRTRTRRLAAHAAAGLAAAIALVCALTLLRAGTLPHFALLLRFMRIFPSAGYALYPMPAIGLHVVVYLTCVAALGVATVRALRGEPDRLLTGMLAWSGVFGLGAGAYFAGRSTPDDLPALFLPWSLTLALLLIPAVGSLRTATWRRPPLAAAACLFGFLMTACSLAQTPTPWGQIERLRQTVPPILAEPAGQAFVAQHTQRGESALILLLLGHRIGANLHVTNVAPYTNSQAIVTAEQLDETIAMLRAEKGRKVFLDLELAEAEIQKALEAAGLRFAGVGAQGQIGLWVDDGGRGTTAR